MNFIKYLPKELIFLDLPCGTKEETIKYLTKNLCVVHQLSFYEEFIKCFLEREKEKSTGLGDHLAVPHGRTSLINRLCVAFARSKAGIDWQALDKKPVNFIFLIIGPIKLEIEYLEALGDISRIMLRHEVREGILAAKNAEDIINIIKKSGKRHKKR